MQVTHILKVAKIIIPVIKNKILSFEKTTIGKLFHIPLNPTK